MPSFKSIKNSSLSPKKYDRHPPKGLRGQNTSVGIGSVELTEPSDISNYKPFFKHCILQTI